LRTPSRRPESFFRDHPHYERNVFIMTRFAAGDRLLGQLDAELRRTLCRHGVEGLRADDRMYPRDRQLWKNVCVYMVCCKYGVAVLEDRLKDEFNPNVALEYGFMRALDKPTLLLADSGFRNLRADVVGTLREEFDLTDIAGTLAQPIEKWIHDLDLDVRAGPSKPQQQALKAHQRLLRIDCAKLAKDEAHRGKEREDEFWYFGEELDRYRKVLQRHPDPVHQAAVDEAGKRVVVDHDLGAVLELIDRFAELAR
jgi:hypothetical protein